MGDRWVRLVPLGATIGLVVANTAGAFTKTGRGPGQSSRGAVVIAYYVKNRSSERTFSLLVVLTVLLFVVFAGFLRSYLRRTDAVEGLAAMVLGAAVLFAAGWAIFAGLDFTLASTAGSLDPSAAQVLNALVNGPIFAGDIGGFLFGVAAGIAILRGAAFPKWRGWVAVVLGVGCLTPWWDIAANLVLLWTLLAAIVMYRRSASPVQAPASVS